MRNRPGWTRRSSCRAACDGHLSARVKNCMGTYMDGGGWVVCLGSDSTAIFPKDKAKEGVNVIESEQLLRDPPWFGRSFTLLYFDCSIPVAPLETPRTNAVGYFLKSSSTNNDPQAHNNGSAAGSARPPCGTSPFRRPFGVVTPACQRRPHAAVPYVARSKIERK